MSAVFDGMTNAAVELRAQRLWREDTLRQLELFNAEWPRELTWYSESDQTREHYRNTAQAQIVQERKREVMLNDAARTLYECSTSERKLRKRPWTATDAATRLIYRQQANLVLKVAGL